MAIVNDFEMKTAGSRQDPGISAASTSNTSHGTNTRSSLHKRAKPTCARCRNHFILTLVRGHKGVCPYRNCACVKCRVVAEGGRLRARQLANWREMDKQIKAMQGKTGSRQDPGISAASTSNNSHDTNTRSSLHKRTIPTCARCRNHFTLILVRGHKPVCPYRNCACLKCHVVAEAGRLRARQLANSREMNRQIKGTQGKKKKLRETDSGPISTAAALVTDVYSIRRGNDSLSSSGSTSGSIDPGTNSIIQPSQQHLQFSPECCRGFTNCAPQLQAATPMTVLLSMIDGSGSVSSSSTTNATVPNVPNTKTDFSSIDSLSKSSTSKISGTLPVMPSDLTNVGRTSIPTQQPVMPPSQCSCGNLPSYGAWGTSNYDILIWQYYLNSIF
jgi:doublesex- and mab-3-related transcription factor 4/5